METSPEVVVKAADMSEELQAAFIEVCQEAITKFTLESDIAAFVKKAMDSLDSPTWHCVAGVSFGSYVAHTRDHFLYIKIKAPQLQVVKDLRLSSGHEWCNLLMFKTS